MTHQERVSLAEEIRQPILDSDGEKKLEEAIIPSWARNGPSKFVLVIPQIQLFDWLSHLRVQVLATPQMSTLSTRVTRLPTSIIHIP
jgi:hypothetical protein